MKYRFKSLNPLVLIFSTLCILWVGCSENHSQSSVISNPSNEAITASESEIDNNEIGGLQDSIMSSDTEMNDMIPNDVVPNDVIPNNGPLFNMRYCEILLAQFESGEIKAEVWGTQSVNLCPNELWEALDENMIAMEYDVTKAIMNGPRYFVVDLSTGSLPETDKENRFYGELEMRYLTTMKRSLSEQPSSYGTVEVDRNNVWHYRAGRRVYELVDPEGRRYIMQAFSQIVDRDLQLEDLENLGDRLALPMGWSFSTRILSEDFAAHNVDGVATVIQDELQNTYQLIPR